MVSASREAGRKFRLGSCRNDYGKFDVAFMAYPGWVGFDPLVAPVSLSETAAQEFRFRPGRTTSYEIEIHLGQELPRTELPRILGEFGFSDGTLDLGWEITSDGVAVADGTNRQLGYSPMSGDGFSGVAIGRFEAQRGRDYRLSLISIDGDPSWDRCRPEVKIGLHPSAQKDFIVYVLIGFALVFVFGSIFVCGLAVVLYRALRGNGRFTARS